MFCDEDNKALNSPVNIPVTIIIISMQPLFNKSHAYRTLQLQVLFQITQSFLLTLLWTPFKILGIYCSKVYHKILNHLLAQSL